MKPCNLFFTVLFLSVSLGHVRSEDAGHHIVDHKIRVGTVEFTSEPGADLVFHWEDGDQKYDLSLNGPDRNGIDSNGVDELPNMRAVGFRTQKGIEHVDKSLPPSVFAYNFQKQHPDEKITSVIYEGINGSRLEINSTGKTAVCRVDILFKDGIQIALWHNIKVIPSLDEQGKPKNATAPKGMQGTEAKGAK